jgi:rhamnulokinase
MLPDLINFLFTQKLSTEVTNASSTQVLNTRTRSWDRELINLAGVREDIFTELHEPGTLIGVVAGFGDLDGINVVATASHDTAAAIAGVPFSNREKEAYISSGTWSLVGVELDAPVLTTEAFTANITNELGVDGTVRALKNVTGMWILEECRRAWHLEGKDFDMPELLEMARAEKTFTTLIDPNDSIFAPPSQMPSRIVKYCLDNGLVAPINPGQFTFCILNSLAHAYKKTLDEISAVTGRTIELIHILGGGSQNELLNQLTADICKVPVKTGPVEATLFGNIAVQAISAGVIADLQSARKLIGKSFTSRTFIPT